MAVFSAIGGAIATSVLGSAAAGTFGYTLLAGVSAAALQAAAGYGLSLIGQSLAGQETDQYSILSKVQAGDNVSRTVPLGYMLTPGSMAYYNSWGEANSFFTQVIALGDVPVRDFGRVIIDGSYVTLLTGDEHADYGYPASEYRKGGIDHLWVKFYDGTQTVADDFLVDDVSSADRPYEDTRVGYGIPYAIVTARAPERSDADEKPLFSGFPKAKFEIDIGMALFDPSDVGQDADIPATWGGVGDLNPAAQLFNVLRGIRYDGEWIAGLQNTTPAMVPAAHWADRIEKAQTAISKPGGGTEPTYRAGLEVRVNEPIRTTVERLLTAMQGRLINVGGIYKLTLGEPDAPVFAFTDAQIETQNNEQSFSPHLSLADTINGIAATFPSPAGGWNDKAAKPIIRTDLEALVGDRRLMASIALNMVPYPAQVQRLMRSALAEAQRERRITLVLGPEAWPLEPGDYVEWTSERNGFIDKLFRVDGVVYRDNLDVVLDLTEVDPSDYDWDPDTDYTAIVDGPIGLINPPAVQVGSPNAFPDTIYDNAAQARRPTIRVEYAGGVAGVRSVRVRVRLDAVAHDGTIIYDEAHPYGSPYVFKLPAGTVLPDVDYEVEVLFVMDSHSIQSDWSAPIDVTTPDVRLTGADIGDEQLGIEHFLRSLAPPQVVTDLDDAVTYEGATAVLTTDGLLYRYIGGAWTTAIPANVLTGQIVSAQIADAAVIADKLATDAVTAVKIAAGAVETAKIAVGAVVAASIDTGAVIAAKIGAGAVTTAKIAADAVTATELAANAVDTAAIQVGAVTSSIIANNAVQTANIDALAVTAAKVANATITATQIANTTITAAQIVAATITGTQIANTTIAAGNIVANTITAAQILSSTITTTQIAANTILAADIAAGTITTTEIAAGTIVAADISAGTITTTEIAANTIVAADIAAGTITTTQIAAGTIVAANIAAGTITGTQIAAATIAAVNIVAGTITASRLVLADFTNLIPDPDFNDTASWSLDGIFSIVGNSNFGTNNYNINSLRMIQSNDNATGLSANVFRGNAVPQPAWLVKGGEQYTASYYARTVSGGVAKGTTQVYARFFDANLTFISETIVGSSLVDEYLFATTIHTAIVTVPVGSAYMDVRVRRGANAAGESVGQFWVWGLNVRRAANADLIVDGAIIAAKITAGTITSTEIASNTITSANILAGTITASDIASGTITATQIQAATITGALIVAGTLTARELILTDYANLVPNGYFDDGGNSIGTYFTAYGTSASIAYNTSNVLTGARSVALSKTGSNSVGFLHNDYISVTEGETYYVEAAVKGSSADGDGFNVQITWYTSAFASISVVSPVNNVGVTTSFVTWGGRAVAPATARYARANVANSSNNAVATVYIDHLTLRHADGANLIVDGTITANHLAANSVTAGKINANAITAGTIAAGAINTSSLMVDGVVITAKILDNAVTNIYTGGSDTEIAANASTTYKTIATVSSVVVPANGNVQLTFTSSGEYGNTCTNQFQILRDAVVQATFYGTVISAGGGGSVAYRYQSAYVLLDAPSAGTYDYIVQVRSLETGGGASAATRWRYTRAVASVYKK